MLLVLLPPLGLIYAVVEILMGLVEVMMKKGKVMGGRKKMETKAIHLVEVVRVILIQMIAVVVIVVMMTRSMTPIKLHTQWNQMYSKSVNVPNRRRRRPR